MPDEGLSLGSLIGWVATSPHSDSLFCVVRVGDGAVAVAVAKPGVTAEAHTTGQHELFEVALLAALHAATPFRGGHIVVSRQVGALLPIAAYGAQQQVEEKTADEDGDSSADSNADRLAHVCRASSRSSSRMNSAIPAPHVLPFTSEAFATVSAI